MKQNRFTVEQIIRMLREAEVHLAQGKSVQQVSRELGVMEQTYYRWRKEYGGMRVSQARRLKELEQENTWLRRAVAKLTVDKVILRVALEGNYSAPSGVEGASVMYRRSWKYLKGELAGYLASPDQHKGSYTSVRKMRMESVTRLLSLQVGMDVMVIVVSRRY